MPVIAYEIVKKPIEQRIIDAACLYWNVERDYFRQKKENTTVTYRKGVVYWLIKHNTVYSYREMAQMFGFLSHQPVIRLVDNIDATKNVIKQTFNDINEITHLADKLDASIITVNQILVNNKVEVEA